VYLYPRLEHVLRKDRTPMGIQPLVH
jgi:hypothetical protein